MAFGRPDCRSVPEASQASGWERDRQRVASELAKEVESGVRERWRFRDADSECRAGGVAVVCSASHLHSLSEV